MRWVVLGPWGWRNTETDTRGATPKHSGGYVLGLSVLTWQSQSAIITVFELVFTSHHHPRLQVSR